MLAERRRMKGPIIRQCQIRAIGEEGLLSGTGVLGLRMERKSGFKECPRCGLRNKPAAGQCDFCGWEFHEHSEDWSAHVKALDRLGHDVDSVVLDDELSKKIESTFVRIPREVPGETQKPPLTVDEIPTIDSEAELREEGRIWTDEHRAHAEMASAQSDEVKVFVDTMIGEPAPEPTPAPPKAEPAVVVAESHVVELQSDRVIEERKKEAIALSLRSGFVLPAGLMGGGVVVYAVALTAYSNAAVGAYLGWGLAVVGALFFTLGAHWFFKRRATARGAEEPMIGGGAVASNEVVICPKCNELVNEDVTSCPSCGARFDRS